MMLVEFFNQGGDAKKREWKVRRFLKTFHVRGGVEKREKNDPWTHSEYPLFALFFFHIFMLVILSYTWHTGGLCCRPSFFLVLHLLMCSWWLGKQNKTISDEIRASGKLFKGVDTTKVIECPKGLGQSRHFVVSTLWAESFVTFFFGGASTF